MSDNIKYSNGVENAVCRFYFSNENYSFVTKYRSSYSYFSSNIESRLQLEKYVHLISQRKQALYYNTSTNLD